MTVTGYNDTFNRTVANGLGTATSGQGYSTSAPSTQFNVAPSTATILPSGAGEKFGVVDLQTQNVDITGQVALSAIPATVLQTVGFISKWSSAANYYSGTMMVATGGAISLRLSKVVGGGLTTLTTVATGLTYVANTFYNLRYQAYWSRPLQTNVLSLKLWAVGATEPGGWMAAITDASFTDYTAGTQVGLYTRDEASVPGVVTARYRSVVARSYSLPMPASSDPMCYDPAIAYPKQTALESLADAVDTVMAGIDPLVSIAEFFPRVRVSNANLVINTALTPVNLPFTTTEFNIGTDTNLGYDPTALYLPVGIWLITFEIRMAEGAADFINLAAFGNITLGEMDIPFRSNPVQSNDEGVGGCGHTSTMAASTDPTTPIKSGLTFIPNNIATNYNIKYMALSAIKVSDYFA